MQYGFYFNSAACVGCKTCQVACKDEKDAPLGTLPRKVFTYEGGGWSSEDARFVPQGLYGYHISVSCNHCEAPACVANCPTGAMRKDDETGIVTSDHDECIGCGSCAASCPYHAPKVPEELGYSLKCDFCGDRLAEGRAPRCVANCPLRALDFGDLGDLQAKYGEGDCAIEPLPEPVTGPSLVVAPHRDARKIGEDDGHVVNFDFEVGLA